MALLVHNNNVSDGKKRHKQNDIIHNQFPLLTSRVEKRRRLRHMESRISYRLRSPLHQFGCSRSIWLRIFSFLCSPSVAVASRARIIQPPRSSSPGLRGPECVLLVCNTEFGANVESEGTTQLIHRCPIDRIGDADENRRGRRGQNAHNERRKKKKTKNLLIKEM